MIVHLKPETSAQLAQQLAEQSRSVLFHDGRRNVLVTYSSLKQLPDYLAPHADEHFPMATDIQLASRDYLPQTREVRWGQYAVGGQTGNTVVIAGPCSIESWEQIQQSAHLLKSLGLGTLRAGCFKPRTSPYSFQGLGLEGLKMLAQVREQHGLSIITEVRDASHVDQVIEYADIVQIGAKAMYDHGILRRCGQARKPVLLKRGFGTTLQEFVQAAEFILSGGNDQVMLCERGIRTFETKTRFTLDLCGVAFLKQETNLPVVLDPSHAMGYAYGVPDLARACVAMGVDGLLVEAHPTPPKALSDAAQQLDHATFAQTLESLRPIAQAVGRRII